ncbi:MAG: isopentenyl-diphosphate Delta-isomerase [Cyclobacteriaceae bacterium]
MTEVVLVDHNDLQLGTMEKLEAHRRGLLHRAVSVFLFNSKGEVMLQRRALTKYHSAGLWTNTCCSHPYPGESAADAARRRLREEMGIDAPLDFSHSFIYKTDLEGGMTEHELDHVFFGYYDGDASPDPEEADQWKFVPLSDLLEDIKLNPKLYTVWMRLILQDSRFQPPVEV